MFINKSIRNILVIFISINVSITVNAIVEFDQDVTNEAIFGSGNANGAFTTDRRNGVEVALRAKIPFVGTTNSNGDGTYSFTLAETDYDNDSLTPSAWNFEFSVNTDFDGSTGNNIDQYTYELGIDGDPGDGADFLVFDPITQVMAPPFYDHSIGDNATLNGAGVEATNAAEYTTLIADNNLLQQSWRNAFFPAPPLDNYESEAAGTYDFYLIVFDGGVEVARTDIKVYINQHDVTSNVIYGTGNSNGNFTINRSSTVEVGLRTKLPFMPPPNTVYDGGHTYEFATGVTWNVDFSVNTDFYDPTSSGDKINAYTYEVGIDQDPLATTDFQTFDPIIGFPANISGNSMGDNSTAQSGGVEPGFFAYNGALGVNNLIQNSNAYNYTGYDNSVAATYDVYLIVLDGATEVARTDIRVLIGGGAPNSAPTTIDDAYSIDEDMALTVINPNGVLANDSDIDGDSLNVDNAGVINATGAGGSITMAADGTFSYSPPLNFNGDATFNLDITDGLLITSSVLTITVNPVNDPPDTVADTNSTDEDTALDVDIIANGVLGNDSDVDGGALTVVEFGPITANDPTAGSVTMFANGKYQYSPPMDFNGTAVFDFTVSDGADTTASSLTITVNPINDEPSFTKGADETVLEDAIAQVRLSWATSINKGAANEIGELLTFHVSNDNNSLFSSQPIIYNTGDLWYVPAADANGTAIVSVFLMDDGGIANGGDDTSATATFEITITSINDEPSFTAGADETVLEDAGAQTVIPWATALSAGPADEVAQVLSFNVANDNNGLFSVQPAIDASGNLTYTPAADARGIATVTVNIADDGGTANSGDDTSVDQTFAINVTPVNDAPIITSTGATSAAEGIAYAYTITATDIDVGDMLTFSDTTLPSWLTFDVNTQLLSGTPTVADIGNHNVTLQVSDNSVDVEQSFVINVELVNDAPSFNLSCDLDMTDVTGQANSVFFFPAFAFDLLVGPVEEQSQTFNLSIDTILNGDPDSIISSLSINNAGDVTIDIGVASNGVATLEITMVDNGGIDNGGIDTAMVQFNLHHYSDFNLDPNYNSLPLNEIIYKNTFDPCR